MVPFDSWMPMTDRAKILRQGEKNCCEQVPLVRNTD